MIDQEIMKLMTSSEDPGERLNEIVDEFREGRDVEEVIVLLDSRNPDLVSFGAWILGELPTDRYNRDDIVSRLRDLTRHDDSGVRFAALGALYSTLLPEDGSTRALLEEMCRDPNKVCLPPTPSLNHPAGLSDCRHEEQPTSRGPGPAS